MKAFFTRFIMVGLVLLTGQTALAQLGDDCTNAILLMANSGTSTYATCAYDDGDVTVSFFQDLLCPADGESLVFQMNNVSPNEKISFILEPAWASGGIAWYLGYGGPCPGANDIDCVSPASTNGPTTASWVNNTGMNQTVYFLVRGKVMGDCGDLTLSWNRLPATDGDNCSSVVDLDAQSVSFCGSTIGLNGGDITQPCITNGARDFIATITVPAGNTLKLSASSLSTTAQHTLRYGSTCPGSTEIECITSMGQNEDIFWTNNTGSSQEVYYIVASDFSSLDLDFCLDWEVFLGENCSNILGLESIDSPHEFTTTGFSSDISGTCLSASGSNDFIASYDVAPGEEFTIDQTTTFTGAQHSLRVGGNCPGDTEIACTAGTTAMSYTNNTGVTQTVYYIVAGTNPGDAGDFTADWSISLTNNNDDCSNATNVSTLATTNQFTGSIFGATDSANPDCSGGNGDITGRGVWYSITGNGDDITVSTCNQGTLINSEISVYTGTCSGTLTCVGYNDDAGGPCGGGSEVTFTSTMGTTYYVYVEELNPQIGGEDIDDFVLSISSPTLLDGEADFGNLPTATWEQAYAQVPSMGTQVWAGGVGDAPDTEVTTQSPDEENGLTINQSELIIGQNNVGAITVELSSTDPNDVVYYRLWYDWDNDGVFDDSTTGSATTPGMTMTPGTYTVDALVDVTPDPALATPGSPYAIRLAVSDSPIGTTASGELSANGEVEDYQTPTPLPVELLTFEARRDNCALYLYWETATEKDFGYYQVEASKDGRTFGVVGQEKPASPNSLELRRYRYAVPRAYHGHYFRLKAVDLDESYEYSPVVFAAAPCANKRYAMSLYPNPNSGDQLMIELNNPSEQTTVTLQLMDMTGHVIRIQEVDLARGLNQIPIETANLASGVYFVQTIGIGQLSTPQRFVRR